jgi:signal transduction histidine kinase/CheY-like chemotaxis protein
MSIYIKTDGDIFLQATVRDITERKQAEEKHAELEARLRQSQKLESVGQLAAGVAHDFNNILTGIIGYVELIADAVPRDTSIMDDITRIGELAERAAGLVRQLLLFSRQEDMEFIPVNINEIIKDTSDMFKRLIRENIELGFIIDDGIGEVLADPGQFQQVLTNLVVNAADAMPSGGKLTIETANVELDEDYAREHADVTPGYYVMLAISDTGCGMDKATQERIFEPFFTTKEVGRGTGLGLSTVYGIVKQHNGNIWVYSEPGRGTVFKIYLPRTDGRKADKGNIILVVEDEPSVLAIVERTLKKQGFQVITAENPEEAEEIFKEQWQDIILLISDVVMPEFDGPELYRRLKVIRPDLKVIFMSGYTDISAPRAGIKDIGTVFLQKPFPSKKMIDAVCKLVGDKSGDRGRE